MKIFLAPRQLGGPPVGGVAQAVYQLGLALTDLGHTVVSTPDEADVFHGHAFDAGEVYTSHGVYPKGDKGEVYNRQLLNNIVAAQSVTAVSHWTANQFRFTNVETRVIPNGIHLSNLQKIPYPLGNYILWAKGSANKTSNAEAFLELANKRKDLKFIMTVAPDSIAVPSNVRVIGTQYHKEMMRFLGSARCYVSTGTENFPIQVLEAMALGTPVLALPRGGVAEMPGIHINEDLVSGLEYCLLNDARIIREQREVVEMFDWSVVARQYLKVYEQVISAKRKRKPSSVSVIIPAYNSAKTVGAAIDSVLSQKPLEVIVVDDGSTDDLGKALKPYKSKIKVITQANAGVSAARNKGVTEAKGDYICCLDADDRLSPTFLAKAKKELDADPGLGIAYPGMTVFDNSVQVSDFDGQPFGFELLTTGNFIPCANLFRKTAWSRAGGYKAINPSWEDYDLWLSITEMGYNALLIPEEKLLYATHQQGRTGQEQKGNFHKLLRATVDGYHPGLYDQSGWVTFIVPCYNQWQFVGDALESIFAQTYPHVRAIIVDDGSTERPTDEQLQVVANRYKRLGISIRNTNGGLSAARNTGLRIADSKWVVMLDADDKVHPDFVAECLKVADDKYVYGDVLTWHVDGSTELIEMPDFDCEDLLKRHQHPCTILIQRQWLVDIGGYDEDMRQGWEDYELAIRLVKSGKCGLRLPKPLFYYRWRDDSMRLKAELVKEEINAYIWGKHSDVAEKGFTMSCCGGNRRLANPVYQDQSAVNNIVVPDGYALLEYTGNKDGSMTKMGGHWRKYDYSAQERFIAVHPNDLSLFGPKFRPILQTRPFQAPPEVKKVVVDPVAAMPEGDEDLTVVEGVTPELQTLLKQNGITTKLKIVAISDKKFGDLLGDRKLARSIKAAAIVLSTENVAA